MGPVCQPQSDYIMAEAYRYIHKYVLGLRVCLNVCERTHTYLCIRVQDMRSSACLCEGQHLIPGSQPSSSDNKSETCPLSLHRNSFGPLIYCSCLCLFGFYFYLINLISAFCCRKKKTGNLFHQIRLLAICFSGQAD